MSEQVSQLASQLLTLPVADRAELARILWDSVESEYVDEATIAIALRRHQELVSGKVAGKTHAEVMEAIRR